MNVNLDPALLGLPSDLLFNGVPMTEGHRYKLENKRIRRYRTLKDGGKYLANNSRRGTDAIEPLLTSHL